MTAGDIVERFAKMMSQPAISKHLFVVRTENLSSGVVVMKPTQDGA
jgi:hypothetical protein